jgi:hypothetical protein
MPSANFAHAFKHFHRLDKREKRLVLQLLALLAATSIAIRIIRLDKVRQQLARYFSPPAELPILPLCRLVALVEGTARYVPGATCLARALVAELTLRRFHYPADLHIGFRKTAPDGLQAHAWIEVRGRGSKMNSAEMNTADYIDFGALPRPGTVFAS